jgi:hypothetical protein
MATNTAENPSTNATECPRTLRRSGAPAAWSWSTDIPVMNERYEGKRGSTQGDRKEKSPPANATGIEISAAPVILAPTVGGVARSL